MAVIVPAATDQIDYADLYARWERGNWSATEIDFSQDRIDWHERFTPEQRRGALWLYSLFLHGEDSVADNLSPYVDAAPLQEQKYFLVTQQVDEARHAVFFHRFLHEVVGLGDGSLASGLSATKPALNWGHRRTFGRLDRMADELRRDRSPRKLAAAVALYHVVVEGTLAQPGQHMIETSLERLDLLPGFRAGMRNVAVDEQRHIAFGVKLSPTSTGPIRRAPRTRSSTSSARSCSGRSACRSRRTGTSPTRRASASRSRISTRRARAPTRRGCAPSACRSTRSPTSRSLMDVSPRERGRHALALLRAGLLGERNGPIGREPETVQVFFDLLARNARGEEVPCGTTIQWDFPDMEPWYLLLEGRTKTAFQGRLAKPTVRLRLRHDDFGELVSQRAQPHRLAIRGACARPAIRACCSSSSGSFADDTSKVRRMLRQGPISRFVHGVIEYAAAVLLIAAPFLFGFESDAAVALSIVAGVVVIAVAASTEGSSSLVDSIPIAAHLLLDFALAAVLIAAPFLFGFSGESTPTAFFIVLGVAHLLVTIGTRFKPAREA